ncbi:hypothetical protein C9374_006974 [Naegleria lovaniensis]|uniref:ZZ-type domain-containing protein n=1 Tax=Naegleria lovaniensis TaxID=51637 RepID=A0AA88KPR2_NAELO|nr:uncharacterized protein C9374_006974 [Naegleria lovaniensis]KAG2393443.1 hypothetical protein C9374_006974 [Naegleria lovaniensis]
MEPSASTSSDHIRNINAKVFIHENGLEHTATQVRRMILPYGQCNLEKFLQQVNEALEVSPLSPNAITIDKYSLRYQDDEKDWIDFSSEVEWTSALHLCYTSQITLFKIQIVPKELYLKKNKMLTSHRFTPYTTSSRNNRQNDRDYLGNVVDILVPPEMQRNLLQLIGKMASTSQENSTSIDAENGPHYGTVCDGCQIKDWMGKRYKCKDCDNFDLCEDCYNNPSIREQHFSGNHTFMLHVLPKIPEQTDDAANMQSLTQSFDKTLTTSPSSNSLSSQAPFEKELLMLHDMGFLNKSKNLILLEKYKGDIQKVVVDLLNESKISNEDNNFYYI